MKIQTKYSIGDKVMVKADKMIIKTCPFCDGVGYRMVEQEKLYCQNCDDGLLKTRSSESEFVEGAVKKIMVSVERNIDIEEDEFDEYVDIDADRKALVEYYINLDDEDNYWGYGTYNQNRIKNVGEV